MTRQDGRLIAGAVAVALLVSVGLADWCEAPPPPEQADKASAAYDQSLLVDPNEFFGVLVERYRGLVTYADQVRIIETIQKSGEAPYQTDRQIICQVDADGTLRVSSAGSQARALLGLTLPLKRGASLERMSRRYDLWLAPHMVLKYADQPLRDFREGIADGFTATEASEVTLDEKPMVQVKLRAGDEDDPHAAEFDLFVNPGSMLIERIHGAQRLPDGGSLETTLEITPRASATAPRAAPVPAPSAAPAQETPTLGR